MWRRLLFIRLIGRRQKEGRFSWPCFDLLYARCTDLPDACLTLTAIHPDGQHPTPSRHILWSDRLAMLEALDALSEANRQGWGAYFAVGLRRPGLTRWRRGGLSDILALPALFVDVDDPSEAACVQLAQAVPTPTCMTFTGGGYHAYWCLDQPLSDMALARRLLKQLAHTLGGDSLSPAQCLRLPGTINTKPQRGGARSRIITQSDKRYPLSAFSLPEPSRQEKPFTHQPHHAANQTLNAALIDAVIQTLSALGYYRRSGDWLSGPCPYPHRHQHEDQHPSFGFNTRTGYGHCYRCGSLLLKDLYAVLGISPATYGGLSA